MSRLIVVTVFVLLAVTGAAVTADVESFPAGEAPSIAGPYYDEYRGISYSIFSPPSCSQAREFVYYLPQGEGPFPIAVYLPGTVSSYDTGEVHLYLQELARRGFLAAAVDYGQNSILCSFGCCYKGKADCVFDAGSETSLISTIAAKLPGDPALGVVAWGHSQGGYVAALSGDKNPFVVRALATGTAKPAGIYECLEPGTRGLASDRLRFILGEHDEVTSPSQADDDGEIPGLRRQLAHLTEQPECANEGLWSCFRGDGSGFYLVQDAEPSDGTADHQYMLFDADGSLWTSDVLDPRYLEDTWRPWSLPAQVDWLAGACGNGVCNTAESPETCSLDCPPSPERPPAGRQSRTGCCQDAP
jgi:dienelactone hydrolase